MNKSEPVYSFRYDILLSHYIFPHPGPLPEQSLKIFLYFGAGRGDEIPSILVSNTV